MNANKAIELGFADDVLTDEKKKKCSDASFSFSGRKTEMALLNKLTAKCKSAEKAEEQETVEEPKPEPQPEETGTPINELEKRLELLK